MPPFFEIRHGVEDGLIRVAKIDTELFSRFELSIWNVPPTWVFR